MTTTSLAPNLNTVSLVQSMNLWTAAQDTYAKRVVVKNIKNATWQKKSAYIGKYIVRGMLAYRQLQSLYDQFSFGERQMLLEKQPEFFLKCMRPYLRDGLSKQQTVDVILQHYGWFESTFSHSVRRAVYQDGFVLKSIPLEASTLQLRLVHDSKFHREGELTLVLCDEQGTKYYMVTFIVVGNKAYIGGLQGGRDMQDFSRMFTKGLYGQRPKSFVVEALRIVLELLGIKQLFAVKNDAHAYSSKRYRKKPVMMDYDALWAELGGTEHNRWYYELPVVAERRQLEEIKRPKRKMYRERYEWLDQCRDDLASQLLQAAR